MINVTSNYTILVCTSLLKCQMKLKIVEVKVITITQLVVHHIQIVVRHEVCLFAWVKYFGMELSKFWKNIAISLSHCFNGRALINELGKIKQLCF
jgi:hypothetical protein